MWLQKQSTHLFACTVGLSLLLAAECRAEAAYAFGQTQTGGWYGGFSYNHKTKEAALADALASCAGENLEATAVCEIKTVFNNSCLGAAVQNGGNGFAYGFGADAKAAGRVAIEQCQKMGRKCSVKHSFCDTVKEKLLICLKPVFKEEQRLRQEVVDNPSRAGFAAAAINYLHSKYCREIDETLVSLNEEVFGHQCHQYSGKFRGEIVYWGECLGAE